MPLNSKPRVALFIDAENLSHSHASATVEQCEKLGHLAIRRCYGNPTALAAWEDAMKAHDIFPMMTPPSATKTNATDFSLTIDAVCLLHRYMFEHAVIASNDAHFIQLALHMREHGRRVTGIGTEHAKDDLVKVYDRFIDIASLRNAGDASESTGQKTYIAAE